MNENKQVKQYIYVKNTDKLRYFSKFIKYRVFPKSNQLSLFFS